jgi:hypothetical protein
MSRFKKISLGLLAIFAVIQFIQPAANKSSKQLPTDITRATGIPETVHSSLKKACYDCHSNNTVYPWYSKIQPFGWMLARHIKNGKEELNFNEFGSYSIRRQISKLNGIANSIKDGTMPLGSYTMLHKNARLTDEEKALLVDWAVKTKDSLTLNK